MSKTPHNSARMENTTPDAPPPQLDLPRDALPRHIAIIMDGNGRWAQQHGHHRILGHARGTKAVKPIVTECVKLGLDALTLYSFSTENWKRPKDEINSLMELCCEYLENERQMMVEQNIRFAHFGRRDSLPNALLKQLDKTLDATKSNTGMTLAIALNYSSRREITDALRTIADKVKQGNINPDDIDEQLINNHLYTATIPDPDMLIRTAGEMRISNFLLWQISYTELWVTDTLWPDFTVSHLHEAIRTFTSRQRRFGALK